MKAMSKSTPVQTSRRHLLKTSTVALAASGVALSSGCFGGFALTKKLYNFNASVTNKWLRWLVFLLFYCFFVYGFVAVIDALVLNTIEFWSGKPAISATKTVEDGENKAVVKSESPDKVVIELRRGKAKVSQLALTRLDNAVLLESSDGHRFYVRDEAGAPESTEIVNPKVLL